MKQKYQLRLRERSSLLGNKNANKCQAKHLNIGTPIIEDKAKDLTYVNFVCVFKN